MRIRDPGWETVRIRDPGWKKVGSGIRDKHPGSATLFLRLKMMCLWVSYKKKNVKRIFASLKTLKKGVGSGVGSVSGSISQRCGSADPDPHPKKSVTDSPTLLSGQN
jgi:hypothetical protein